MNLQQILDQSPECPGYGGGKWAMYAVGCCWWTSFPEDLGVNAVGLPCCPHCGSVLMQAPLEDFVKTAQANPEHYGKFGIETFVQTHSRNSAFCRNAFAWYELKLARRSDELTPEQQAEIERLNKKVSDVDRLWAELVRARGDLLVTLTHGTEQYADEYLQQLEELLDAALMMQGFSRIETEKHVDAVEFRYRQFAYPLANSRGPENP